MLWEPGNLYNCPLTRQGPPHHAARHQYQRPCFFPGVPLCFLSTSVEWPARQPAITERERTRRAVSSGMDRETSNQLPLTYTLSTLRLGCGPAASDTCHFQLSCLSGEQKALLPFCLRFVREMREQFRVLIMYKAPEFTTWDVERDEVYR